MAKVLVFQHVPYEPLGTLDPLIRDRRHRIRYVNFGREPHAKPSIQGYDALILLGGPMNIGQEADYPHLEVEKKLVREALEADIPVLGICLGAQLIASALGGQVYQAPENEIGWYSMRPSESAQSDPLIRHFKTEEPIFQWHGYTFDLPQQAELLVTGDAIPNQAFRVGSKVYGFQFHLEASRPLIKRWLDLPQHQVELGLDKAPNRRKNIWAETESNIERSLDLSRKVFTAFLDLLPKVNARHHFSHRHFY